MDEPTPKQNQDPPEPPPPTGELAPLTILRTETVLSKYPIHNLAKKGTIDIQITKKNERGKIDFNWKVSPNPAYGLPRQLAYKLDTVVINRRFDEVGRPLPEIIRLGSLRDVAKDLGLGNDTPSVRKAFLQNASAFITAKVRYRGLDGTDHILEAGFTRYTVVFTGEKLSNGRKADAVYIELHPRYREVLNNAPVRPLNYDYLRELPPGPQRFYEIVSYRIYAAFKFRNPEARLKYSDYCTFSAQQRYFDYDHFKKQMYKVHRPHLQSGYLAKVRYEQTTDADNHTDWFMYYTPGQKARAEYHAFTKRLTTIPSPSDPEVEAGEPLASAPTPRAHDQLQAAGVGDTPPEPAPAPPAAGNPTIAPVIDPDLVAQLTRRGILETRARKLLQKLADGQEVIDQLEWGDYLISQAQPGTFRNPPGFYISLIRDNVIPPGTFENSRRRALREERERAHQQWLFEQQQLRSDYDRYCEQEKERYIRENFPQERFQELFQAKHQQFKRQYPWLPDQTITDMANGAIRGELEPHIAFLGFEEWKNRRSQQSPATAPEAASAKPEQGNMIGNSPTSTHPPPAL